MLKLFKPTNAAQRKRETFKLPRNASFIAPRPSKFVSRKNQAPRQNAVNVHITLLSSFSSFPFYSTV